MKKQKIILFLLSLLSFSSAVAQTFRDVPLLDALQSISRNQPEYTIDILSDGLDKLHTTAKVTGLAAPDAVKRLSKGLPVKVKVRGRHIAVQMKKRQVPKVQTVDLSGDVEDGFLKRPLPKAKVSVLTADSVVIADSLQIIYFLNGDNRITKAHFGTKVRTGRDYLVRAQLKGYDDAWKRVSVGRQATEDINIGTLQMRKMRNLNLDEVVVTATRVKFYYRGDTLIYDATAFKLPEGSMLDDLIRQLPGVTLNDQGEIFVNGRKVDELLLGSRSFFGGNKKVLMENLPYYTVKNLKVYEKQTDKSEALGYDVEPRRYVMDVNLKDEYSQGYIANVEAAGGTEERWLGRGFLLGFTDKLRLTVLANANNVNETRHVGQSGQWSPARLPRSIITTRSVASELSYHSEGDKLKETLRGEYNSTTDAQTMNQHQERFVGGLTPTAFTESFSKMGNRRWSLHNMLTLKLPTYMNIEADFNHTRRNGATHSTFEEFTDTLSIAQRTVGISRGTKWAASLDAQGSVRDGRQNQHLDFYTHLDLSNDEGEQGNLFKVTKLKSHEVTKHPSGVETRNANSLYSRNASALLSLGFGKELGQNLHFGISDLMAYLRIHSRDNLYHPASTVGPTGEAEPADPLLPSQIDALAATLDPANSYESRAVTRQNDMTFSLNKTGHYTHSIAHMKVNYDRWRLELQVPMHFYRLRYRRGSLDTLARQTAIFPNPSFRYRNVWKDSRRDLQVRISYRQTETEILNRISYRDHSQPLVVKLGNPDLKPSAQTNLSLDYYDGKEPGGGMYHASASFSYHHRDVAQSLTYDPATGISTFKPMNVSGAYNAHANFSTDHSIGKKRYWTWHADAGIDWNHAKDHAMLTGMLESQVNTVNTLSLNSGGNIRFHRKTLNIRAVGYINWRHSDGKMYDFTTLNALDYHYGLEATYTTPALWGTKIGGLTLAADATMYGRRYGSAELNTNDFIVNASLSQPFLNGKLIARLEAFDLLHQLSDTHYVINAMGRTVTCYRSLPHYVMLHMVFHWSRQGKH
ncbi:MAG: outer membrane beta-barrel protein [Prevotella sp.]|nr:outer membrane beta-barrel protein [Prevotella sp.]